MATAVELLSKTIEEILVIDSSLRTINIPASVTNIGVESDDETTRLNFQMPRFNDGIDLKDFVVRINYENAGGEGDVYEATDVVVNDDIITFSWLVGRFAVMYKGTVKFIVCLKKLGNDGTVDKEFNTTVATLPVLEGLETEEAAVEANMDVIAAAAYEAILLGLDNGLKGDPGYTPVKGTDYYTSAERDEFAEEVVNAAKGVYANAYKQTVTGEVIRVDDVSPLEHTVGVTVKSKNLLPVGTIELTKNQNVKLDNPIPPGTYTLSAHITSSDTDGELSSVSINSGSNVLKYVAFNRNKRVHTTFTVTEPITAFDFCAAYNYSQGVDDTATWSDIQLEIGNTVTDYKPYVDPSTVTLTRCGKAIMSISEKELSRESSAWTSINLGSVKIGPGNYIARCSFEQVGADKSQVSLTARGYHDYTVTINSVYSGDTSGTLTLPFTVTEEHGGFQIFAYSNHGGTALSTRCKFKNFMVEVGSEATAFEVYSGETYTPSSNGIVENVCSVSPSMTLYTDTPGVTIEAEYSRDTNALIGDISAALDVLIGMQEATIDKLDDMAGGAS